MKKAEKLDSDENSTHAKNRHYSTGGSVVTADIVMKANHKILNRFWESRRFCVVGGAFQVQLVQILAQMNPLTVSFVLRGESLL